MSDFLTGIGEFRRSFITKVSIYLGGKTRDEEMGILTECTGIKDLTVVLGWHLGLRQVKLGGCGVRRLMEIRGCEKVTVRLGLGRLYGDWNDEAVRFPERELEYFTKMLRQQMCQDR